jgi:hypothetical protein
MKNKNRLNYFFLLFLCGVLLLLVGSLVWNMYRGNRSFAESAEERAEQPEGSLCTVSDEAAPAPCGAGEKKAPAGRDPHVVSAQEKLSRHLELLDIIHGEAPAAPVAEQRPTPPPAAAPEENKGVQQGWVNPEEGAQVIRPKTTLRGPRVPRFPLAQQDYSDEKNHHPYGHDDCPFGNTG